MSESKFIISVQPANTFLAFICVSPFEWNENELQRNLNYKCYHILYHVTSLLVYEMIFFPMIYLNFFKTKMDSNISDTCIFAAWILIGCLFTVGVLLSIFNRSAQMQLFYEVNKFDVELRVKLKIVMSYRRLNFIFTVIVFQLVFFHLSFYIYLGIYYEDKVLQWLFYLCCTISDTYFSVYSVYIIYWGKVFVQQSNHLIDGLEVLTMMSFISTETFQDILELIKISCVVRDCISEAFGSMLFLLITLYSLTIAISVYVVIHTIGSPNESILDVAIYMLWTIPLWIKLCSIVVVFNQFGVLVSPWRLLDFNYYYFQQLCILQVNKIQKIVSGTHIENDKKITNCVIYSINSKTMTLNYLLVLMSFLFFSLTYLI